MLPAMEERFLRLVNRTPFVGGSSLTREQMAARISAYIYGNILVLAALIPVTESHDRFGIAVIVGAAVTTFIAHYFAELVGRSVREHTVTTREARLAELRDSLPILVAAVVPSLILALAVVGLFEPRTAQLIAELFMVLRIATISYVIVRIRKERVTSRTHWTAIGLGTLAMVIVALKLAFGH
jgi:hypothetical protein